MNYVRTPLCAICGQDGPASQPRFLIAENNWEGKLTILQWNEAMAIEHVEELVIHWMTTGRLDYPFARTSYGALAGGAHPCLTPSTSTGRGPLENLRCTARAWNEC
jgi:hypothetical protein